MYACLAVTCHLHFWQNDRDFLRATVVTRGWNGYRNKSQHRKSTLEKKILPPFQQGFEPATFQSRVRCSNHWTIPAPPGRKTPTYLLVTCGSKWLLMSDCHFLWHIILNIHCNGVLTVLFGCYIVVPHETAAVSVCSVYTVQPCTMSLHTKPLTQGACVFSCNWPPARLGKMTRTFYMLQQ